MIKRREDWLERLESYMARPTPPWSYGEFDCALDVANAVEAMTGTDLGADWRGKYKTRAGGLKLVRAAGHSSHFDVFAAVMEGVPPGAANVGDVVELPGRTLGIVQGRFVWAASEAGRVLVPTEQVTRALRIPRE